MRLLGFAIVLAYAVILVDYGWKTLFLIFLVIGILGAAAFLVLRWMPTSHSSVTLRGVSRSYALASAAHVIQVLDDDKFGFPSGTFIVSPGMTADSIVANEFKPSSRGGASLLAVLRIPWKLTGFIVSFVATIADSGIVLFAGQLVRIVTAGFILLTFIVPLGLAWIMEIVLKPLVASLITVNAVPTGDEVTLHLAFRGATALAVKKRCLAAFAEPDLPARFTQYAQVPAVTT